MKLRQILLAFGAIGFCMAVEATPITVTDNYVGADDHSYGDVIGNTSVFDISKAVIDFSGTMLTVDVYTNFVHYAGTSSALGTEFGDLFLNNTWHPYGSIPYSDDNASNGTAWGWGLSMNSVTGTSGKVTLYELVANNAGALLSEEVFGATHSTPPYIYRDGQEVRVDTSSSGPNSSTGVTGTWKTVDPTGTGSDYLQFTINLADTNLLSHIDPAQNGTGELAFHWAMTCANDVIEGKVETPVFPSQIPEPTALSLLGLGLGLMGVRFRRRGHERA